jgi:hypothetical protein
MPISPSGSVSLGVIQTEFGGSNPIALSEYYRGGTYVPNTERNSLAATIPTSGQISISQIRNSASFQLQYLTTIDITSYSPIEYRNVAVDISSTSGENRYVIVSSGTFSNNLSGIPEYPSVNDFYPRINDGGTKVYLDSFYDDGDEGCGVSMSYAAVDPNATSVNIGWYCPYVEDEFSGTIYVNPSIAGGLSVFLVTSKVPLTLTVEDTTVNKNPGTSYNFTSNTPNGFLISQHVRTDPTGWTQYDDMVGLSNVKCFYDEYQTSGSTLAYTISVSGYDSILTSASFSYS